MSSPSSITPIFTLGRTSLAYATWKQQQTEYVPSVKLKGPCKTS